MAPNTQPSAKVHKAFASKIVPLLRSQSSQIRKLSRPKADKAKIESMLGALDTAINKIEKDPLLVLSGDQIFASADKQAIAYGLKVCGKSDS